MLLNASRLVILSAVKNSSWQLLLLKPKEKKIKRKRSNRRRRRSSQSLKLKSRTMSNNSKIKLRRNGSKVRQISTNSSSKQLLSKSITLS